MVRNNPSAPKSPPQGPARGPGTRPKIAHERKSSWFLGQPSLRRVLLKMALACSKGDGGWRAFQAANKKPGSIASSPAEGEGKRRSRYGTVSSSGAKPAAETV